MKAKRILSILLIMMCVALTACGGGGGEPAEPDPEKAMDNIITKVEAGNYVVEGGEFLTTTVASRDQVVFEYGDESYNDFAVVSVDDEIFQGVLAGNSLMNVRFMGEGQAVDAEKSRLLNYWTDESVSEGNIWNLFYNTPEDPLKFMSNDETVKNTVLSFVGYGENTMRLMHEVYLILDKEDPDSARIQAEMDEDLVARISLDDIDIGITFGNAETNAVADAWMKDPDYPEARTAWTEADEFVFNSVFMPGYGLEAIPFPSFASYAFSVDQENFLMTDEVSMRDHHATEQDMADYAETLKANGFAEVKDTAADGTEKTYYRKMLREDYSCYSSINLEYNDGLDITARKYYDFPKYEGVDAVNGALDKAGFPALPESDNFTAYLGTDRANEMTESWLYFFDYDLGMYVDISYEDYDEAVTYVKEYEKILEEAGFIYDTGAEEGEELDEETTELFSAEGGPLGDEEAGDERYESADGFRSFRYNFVEDGVVSLLFKAQRYISASEADQTLTAAGFPALGLTDPISCRDLRQFRKVQYGRDDDTYVTLSTRFDSAEEAEAFLNDYEVSLNAIGFDRINPGNVGSTKDIAIANADGSMYVGVDFFPEEAMVNMEFCVQ